MKTLENAQPMDKQFTQELLSTRQKRAVSLPVKGEVAAFSEAFMRILFPHFSDTLYYSAEEIEGALQILKRDLRSALRPVEAQTPHSADEVAERFFAASPAIYRMLEEDALAIYNGDPAAESVDEVISAYPGFLAIAHYRIAHEFCALGVPIFPRILTEIAHQRTGIDIHPGAKIGRSFFIDHGTGIVIGETTIIGDNVKLYQGVTLGALSVAKTLSTVKRHPTIEDRVVIYSNATILGGATVIGHDSIIGGNVWLTESVPPFSAVYHKSEIRVRDSRQENMLPDFVI
ncbi:MAG TPA: serine O-acetyltransferase EpsC [Bacteroidota bacterium]|nr:serine O-acetyltransferase EpsC [Bacteroidota bacterium]